MEQTGWEALWKRGSVGLWECGGCGNVDEVGLYHCGDWQHGEDDLQ